MIFKYEMNIFYDYHKNFIYDYEFINGSYQMIFKNYNTETIIFNLN